MYRLRKASNTVLWTTASVAHSPASGGHRWLSTSNTIVTANTTWPTTAQHVIPLTKNTDIVLLSIQVTGITSTATNAAAQNDSSFRAWAVGVPNLGQTNAGSLTSNPWYTAFANANADAPSGYGVSLTTMASIPASTPAATGATQLFGINQGVDGNFGRALWTPNNNAVVNDWGLRTSQTFQVHFWITLSGTAGGANAFSDAYRMGISDVCSHIIIGAKGVDGTITGGTVTFSGEMRATGYEVSERR